LNLHEYQAKTLLAEHGVPVPTGLAVASEHELADALALLPHGPWVVKAQIHAGARGKAGGVRLIQCEDELAPVVNSLLGRRLVTEQTGAEGLPVAKVLVEQAGAIARELYVSLSIDRSLERVVLLTAPGGMEVEALAEAHPEQVLRQAIDPAFGLAPYQCRRAGFALGLDGAARKGLETVLMALWRLWQQSDAELIELNPLAVMADGHLCAVDAKIALDPNALFRQPRLVNWRDPAQEDPREYAAARHGLNFVALHGSIGCMVNGAGLAMATMDLIQNAGGRPANFLDVGGTATAERVAAAFRLIMADPHVRAIWVNIFGGIVRCDLIAQGIIQAAGEVGLKVPVVVRLEGTNAEAGRTLLAGSGLDLTPVADLAEAARAAVAAARGLTAGGSGSQEVAA